tara:strand:- start:1169 stop:1918 length:750 start_codon:yes stop_codon:yes gene_type:complete
MIYKLLSKLIISLNNLLPISFKIKHKFQNRNQVTNLDIIISSLKNKKFNPDYIVDIGCFRGIWTEKLLKFFPKSKYILFDADNKNIEYLEKIKSNNKNIDYKIKLLSDDEKDYDFFSMDSGSSIFEEQTNYSRKIKKIKSSLLCNELPNELKNTKSNLIKLDVQGAELKIIAGLKEFINNFEVIILEVSLHRYNKNSPLFYDVISYMQNKKYILYDIYDLKRLGDRDSYLLQFDCVFLRESSNLLEVKF